MNQIHPGRNVNSKCRNPFKVSSRWGTIAGYQWICSWCLLGRVSKESKELVAFEIPSHNTRKQICPRHRWDLWIYKYFKLVSFQGGSKRQFPIFVYSYKISDLFPKYTDGTKLDSNIGVSPPGFGGWKLQAEFHPLKSHRNKNFKKFVGLMKGL